MAYWDKNSCAYYTSITLNEKRKRIKLPSVTRQRKTDEIESKIRLQIITREYQNLKTKKPVKMTDELARLYFDNYPRVNNRECIKTNNIKKRGKYSPSPLGRYQRPLKPSTCF